MVNDTISDVLTRIRNANLVRHQIVQIPDSKMTHNVIRVLREEGFIQGYEKVGEGYKSSLLISLKYRGKKRYPVIKALKRISKPGLRVYANNKNLPRVLGGLGVAIISTSEGVMTDRQARFSNLGGEVLCYVW